MVDDAPEKLAQFNAGELTTLVADLHERNDPSSSILQLRAYNRLRENQKVIERSSLILKQNLSTSQRVETMLLRSCAFLLEGRNSEAKVALATANRLGRACPPRLISEILHVRGALFLAQGDLGSAKVFIRRSLQLPKDNDVAECWRRSFVRAQAMESLAIIALAQGRQLISKACLQVAIRTLEDERPINRPLYAHLLTNLAAQLREFDDLADVSFVGQRLRRMHWSSDLQKHRASIERALFVYELVNGAEEIASKMLRRISFSSSDLATKTLVVAEDAIAFGITDCTRQSLLQVFGAARSVKWDRGEERFVLLKLAEACSLFSATIGRQVMNMYREIQRPLDPLLCHNFSNLRNADESFAEGFVLKSEGRAESAATAFISAFEVFVRERCEWRAALAAAQISLLRRSSQHRNYATRIAMTRAGAWFRRALLAC